MKVSYGPTPATIAIAEDIFRLVFEYGVSVECGKLAVLS